MYFVKSFVALAVAFATVLASATPDVDRRAERGLLERQSGNNCQYRIGDCYSNGCDPMFQAPSDTIGICSTGTYAGCPCDKCGGGNGHIGYCDVNGCNGLDAICTAGPYNGCPCLIPGPRLA